MTVYEVPPQSPYHRHVRVLGWGAIIVLLGILLFSLYEPAGFRDSVSHAIGWLAGVIVFAAIVGTTLLAVREGTWKLLSKAKYDISDGRITQKSEASSPIEIPLDQIEYLHEYRGRLLVGSKNPKRQIAIPREVDGFDVIKRELVAHCALTSPKAKINPLSFFPLALMIVAYSFLFTSHSRALVITAGVTALVLQGIGTYSLQRVWRGRPMPKLLMPAFVLTSLLLAWFVYRQISGTSVGFK